MDINLNQQAIENCLKEVHNIGGTTFQNICDGSSSYVAWGAGDWLVNLTMSGMILVVLVTVVLFLVAIVSVSDSNFK